MPVTIHGKEYKTVAERVTEIHKTNKGKAFSIETDLVSWTDGVVIFKATISTPHGIFTGHAYEDIGSSKINTTSALENCETSAIGRALASAGYIATEFASADELVNALAQQADGTTNVAPGPKKTTSTDEASSKQKGFILKLNREKDYIAETDMELKLQKMNKSEASDLIEFLQDWDKTKERLKEKTTSSEEEVDSLFA